MRNLHPVIQRMICETAKMYAITEVDSYLHIDNFMSINKRKFKPNARVAFAERVIAEAATPAPTDPAKVGTAPMAKEHYELYLSGIITEAQYNKFKKKK